jgi:hypothetical protein
VLDWTPIKDQLGLGHPTFGTHGLEHSLWPNKGKGELWT